jgi:hypothetical protein
LAVSQDRLVQRVGQPGLQVCIEVGQAKDLVRGLAACIQCAVELHHAQCQRAGLVGAEHVHAAKVLDRLQAPDDDTPGSHGLRAAGEVDADDGGQKLRSQAHGQGDGKEE